MRRAGTCALLALCVAVGACSRSRPEVAARLDVAAALGGAEAAGFERATVPRPFSFPADHGPHEGYRTEWWYVTGNLAAEDGRRFGFQLTFFRNALAPVMPARTSPWAARDVWMAHFALTDGATGRFVFRERFERGGAGLAGAQSEPFRAWLDDWRIESATGGAFPWRLVARDGATAIDLELAPGRPPVLQGDAGLSRKGAEPGNASYYYSLTRMPANGSVSVGGAPIAVRGNAWLDREWSTSALGASVVGWDWFALQLDDGRDLMFYRLRRADGSSDPFSAGSIVDASGTVTRLAAGDVELAPRGTWTSPATHGAYPGSWSLRVPRAGLDLVVNPLVAGQELDALVAYWEGAVVVSGSSTGRGYLEMTGYAARR